MKLRSKLFLSFAGIFVIVIALGVLMTVSLREMTRQSRVVDKVDSALLEGLTAQGRALRFVIYKDRQYSDQAAKGLLQTQNIFEGAKADVTDPRNVKLLGDQMNFIREVERVFDEIIKNDDMRLAVDGKLVPLTAELSKALGQLKSNVSDTLRTEYSQELMGIYESLVAVGEQFMEARLNARLYVDSPTPENERKTIDALQRTIKSIQALASQATEGKNIQLVNKVISIIGDYEKEFKQMIANTNAAQQLYGNFRELFVKMVASGVELSRNATANLLTTGNVTELSMLVGTGVIMVLCVLIALLLARNVLAQLGKDPGELVTIAKRVTGGDYNIDDGSSKIGVYGDLVSMVGALEENIENARRESERAAEESRNATEAMRKAESAGAEAQAKTQSMLKAADRLEEVANIVSSASAELSAQIEQSERGASEQAARVSETATAMEEMNSTVLEVAKNAGSASDVSARTRDRAEAGAEVVRQSVASIRQVQTQATHLKEDMVRLDENAKDISRIMGVISDIADQTNLLALNAAIEAARAGEAGRGFAVVADEVRKLAEKTMASTTDVGNAINAIQQSVSQSMQQVDMSVKSIEEATNFANRSGEALQEIVSMVDSTADQVRAIATASEQQSASSEEINQSIEQVNTIAGETARAMEEAARAVSDLAAQAQALSSLIDDMKRG